ncbi:hypothetical protein GCM10027258_26250 [Amycolatopsis stemonae]
MHGGPTTVAILARDEERCIGRCLDSVSGRGFDRILVLDTGSGDRTREIVDTYAARGVERIDVPWRGSFARARNAAIDVAGEGWVVFVDADEWLAETREASLTARLGVAVSDRDPGRIVFAPRIRDEERGEHSEPIPRILRAGGAVRFRGAVHEYPYLAGETPESVEVVPFDVEFRHDGYRRSVAAAKDKRNRNLALLRQATTAEPDNPRWLFFTLRDGLPVLGRARIAELLGELRRLVGAPLRHGDRRTAADYYRSALCCWGQALVALGDRPAVLGCCAELDRIGGGESPDAHYFRSMFEVIGGAVTRRSLLRTVALRKDAEAVGGSGLDPAGRHLDALIALQLRHAVGDETAEEYLELSEHWNDVFFAASRLRAEYVA